MHTTSAPSELPFHAESFGWEEFERFCAAYFVAGISLPNLSLPENSGRGPNRLRVVDAVRYGTAGAKQLGIDFLVKMEDGTIWVVQCKRMIKFARGNAEKAIAKAEAEFGSRNPAKYLLWVTGKVSPDALDVVGAHKDWTVWDGERISNEFLLYTPRRQAFQIISSSFGAGWAKAFFPLPDDLLITSAEFFARWSGEDRLFHHRAVFVGRGDLLDRVSAFAKGGKGSKALILSAPGGIGKTRLLRAVAERVEAEEPGRLVRFTNPIAGTASEPPRDEGMARMTVFHDDAHRIETLHKQLIGILASEKAAGSCLVLATRPGAEDVLREFLMEAGYRSDNIETIPRLEKLRGAEMKQLAADCLGAAKAHLAEPLAKLSGGCALITLVGAELLRRGDIAHLDLTRSADFRTAVFRRFEGQELDRISGTLDRPLMARLLKCIALLSPWDDSKLAAQEAMAAFLGIQRGQVFAACEALMTSGLLLRSRDGLRITPDLFSDHLVYSGCYDDAGKVTAFIVQFLDQFAEEHSQIILNNLAEAEWRAFQQHGEKAASVIAPIWQRFLSDFTKASFWDRSQMMERWARFAIYQPERSLDLAEWALDMNTAPAVGGAFGSNLDKHERVLLQIPPLLKPVAIWSNDHRQRALDLLWRLRRDFPFADSETRDGPFQVFAEIANFKYNYPDAPSGVLDWLDRLLDGDEGATIADKSCGLLDATLRPFFAQTVERTYWTDKRTLNWSHIPISVVKTKAIRHRALALLTEKIIPRGTVAAMNALPTLAEAFRQTADFHRIPSAAERAWRPERALALKAVADMASRYQHPLIHFDIRHKLRWHVIYDKDENDKAACTHIVSNLSDSFELRLARLTLSWSHDDLLESFDQNNTEQWHERNESHWQALKHDVISELLARYSTGNAAHGFLHGWSLMCLAHGLTPHLYELLG